MKLSRIFKPKKHKLTKNRLRDKIEKFGNEFYAKYGEIMGRLANS